MNSTDDDLHSNGDSLKASFSAGPRRLRLKQVSIGGSKAGLTGLISSLKASFRRALTLRSSRLLLYRDLNSRASGLLSIHRGVLVHQSNRLILQLVQSNGALTLYRLIGLVSKGLFLWTKKTRASVHNRAPGGTNCLD